MDSRYRPSAAYRNAAFVDVEPDELGRRGSRLSTSVSGRSAIRTPSALRDQLPERRQQEDASADRRIQNPGRLGGVRVVPVRGTHARTMSSAIGLRGEVSAFAPLPSSRMLPS